MSTPGSCATVAQELSTCIVADNTPGTRWSAWVISAADEADVVPSTRRLVWERMSARSGGIVGAEITATQPWRRYQ